jgi:hypothetical protein
MAPGRIAQRDYEYVRLRSECPGAVSDRAGDEVRLISHQLKAHGDLGIEPGRISPVRALTGDLAELQEIRLRR